MKQYLLFSFLLLSCCVYGQEQSKVKQTFSNYKQSILKGDGDEAVKWVNNKTIAYYGEMLGLALDADSARVADLDLMDRLTVLSLRHRMTRDEISGMDGKQLFVHSIKKGMVGKNTVANVEIGDVKVEGEQAKGQLQANGQKSPLNFGFTKENGQWKLDLTSLFEPTMAGLKQMIAGQGMTENEFIVRALEMSSGKPVTNVIWSPLK
jgi:hypothetical protein